MRDSCTSLGGEKSLDVLERVRGTLPALFLLQGNTAQGWTSQWIPLPWGKDRMMNACIPQLPRTLLVKPVSQTQHPEYSSGYFMTSGVVDIEKDVDKNMDFKEMWFLLTEFRTPADSPPMSQWENLTWGFLNVQSVKFTSPSTLWPAPCAHAQVQPVVDTECMQKTDQDLWISKKPQIWAVVPPSENKRSSAASLLSCKN